ncbi:ribonuclease, Barnase family [Campylobacter blaseri]|uniref:Ribonuclease n=1 Tax=Campylobacter blaseri TaxID=2042961 RepID=A0A2P8R449_9BACT|nr:ribonuclease domain-containing protein [Campylobacter blaseri]PSM53282.1 ribonuclease [Campylobacter blaseri]PSM54748.1 ribonuclease [Campylobacter blaseri]QKF86770.1 ribonuclease, Barnase family [Campylobacter blaseri]
MYKKILPILIFLFVAIFSFIYQTDEATAPKQTYSEQQYKINKNQSIVQNGSYTSKKEVSSYIFKYKSLPKNYITKKEAMKLGWQSKSYNLWDVAPNKSIGGDRFGNYENKLPNKSGRVWRECDIDYKGGNRNAKRLVFSNDGLIYYTSDHYNSFEKIDKVVK